MATTSSIPSMSSTSGTSNLTTVCVFCAAGSGNDPIHLAAARSLAEVFAKNDIRLVYGAATTGMMGELARTLVSLAGPDSVQGVIPTAMLALEAQQHLSEATETKSGDANDEVISPQEKHDNAAALSHDRPHDERYGKTPIYTTSMHERKTIMASLVRAGGPGSGFIALSGGYGTLEEIAEMITWNQLGIHDRGLVLYNVKGYWDGLLNWIGNSVEEGFITAANGAILAVATTAEGCVEALRGYENSEGRVSLKWDEK